LDGKRERERETARERQRRAEELWDERREETGTLGIAHDGTVSGQISLVSRISRVSTNASFNTQRPRTLGRSQEK